MIMKPVTTEKAVKLIDVENTLIFEVPKEVTKPEIQKEVEHLFKVKVDKIRTLIHLNKKFAYIRLNKNNLAADIATKLGML
ncbi:MAG: 50S ribosomal protein L23 [Nanoarchaeota archaeon]